LAERLTAWLRARAAAGVVVLLGDPGRSYFPKSGVEKLATYSVQTTRELEDREIRETSVYALLPS
jgi:predicted nicotinamide N-methyase